MAKKLPTMRYKGYTWKNNPSRCSYVCERDVVMHKYPEVIGSDMEDLYVQHAVITGSGTFFGETAYDDWRELLSYMKDNTGPGEFYHPVFPDVTNAILKRLEASLEPAENFVAYTFEFWQHSTPQSNSSAVTVVQASSPTVVSVTPPTDTIYTVQLGDSLWNILKKLGSNPTTWPTVAKYNQLSNPHLIYPGQKLKIPRG